VWIEGARMIEILEGRRICDPSINYVSCATMRNLRWNLESAPNSDLTDTRTELVRRHPH